MSTEAPTYTQFITDYPEFTTMRKPQVELQLTLSAALLSQPAWDTFYSEGVMLDAAHTLAVRAAAGQTPTGGFQAAVGPITSASGAGVSTSFATVSVDSKSKSGVWYNKTSYGQLFLRLRDAVIAPGCLSA